MLTFSTTLGDIGIEVFPDEAPVTVENFLRYVREGFYDGTIFHRVIPNFVIQGGGFTADMARKPTHDPIRNEADNGLVNAVYTLSMARTADVNSATSQFFINLADNKFLDHGVRDFGYAVFGKVVSGTGIVDRIGGVRTGRVGGHSDVPLTPVVVSQARAD